MKTITKVPGKLILLGEYAVLEGASALVTTVNRFAKVTFTTSENSTFSLQAPTIGIPALRFLIDATGKVRFLKTPLEKTSKKLSFFISIFEYGIHLLKRSGKLIIPAQILLDTSAFFHHNRTVKLGLGSSAALTVALIASLLTQDTGTPPHVDELFNVALKAHRAAQGDVGSGIDIAASVYGGILQYKIDPKTKPLQTELIHLPMPDTLFMLPIWMGRSSSTSELVKLFYRFKTQNRAEYHSLVAEMKEVTLVGCQAFKNGDIPQFLESIRSYNRLMKKLGQKSNASIVSKEHETMTRMAEELGVAYKPSGAGGGDIGLCFTDSPEALTELKKKIQKANFEALDLTHEPSGIQIEQNEVEVYEDIAHS